jgi:hypothetical protein
VGSRLLDLIVSLAAAGVGVLIGYGYRTLREALGRRKRHGAVNEFYGVSSGGLIVIHPAYYDNAAGLHAYPAPDAKAARMLARLFESVGFREDQTFHVLTTQNEPPIGALRDNNIVLLCGPRLNPLTREVLASLDSRYKLTADLERQRNRLFDKQRNSELISSRDCQDADPAKPYDYALIVSAPSPWNIGRRVVVYAGLKGIGTLGAATHGTVLKNLQALNQRRDTHSGAVAEIVRIDYTVRTLNQDQHVETVSMTSLV